MTLSHTPQVLVIPGDGIGPEVIAAAVAILRATGLAIDIRFAEAGWDCFQRHGRALPAETLMAAQQADAILFGAVASPSFAVEGYRSPIVELRRTLDLYANLRPVLSADRRVDLMVVRENTEGLYAGRERLEDAGSTAIAERVITRRASERIVRAAFELAITRNQPDPHVTLVHKANVLRATCGLFRTVGLEVARDYPSVRCDELLVDTCAMQLVQQPERFDVLVTTNLFGDILSDVACCWGGGLGLATSANLGAERALFEPVHGAAPDIAGQGLANPLAAIGCVAWMLHYLAPRSGVQSQQFLEAATRIRAACAQTLADGPHTRDLGGTATTNQVLTAIHKGIGSPFQSAGATRIQSV